jgi:predicted O-linked N-acetylglucosamine transferase (SPINDLY family)
MDAWIRALKDHENACLWLLDDNPSATQQLKQYLAQAGVPPHRYVFSPRSSHLEYRQRLTLADLYLDTYPYNAGSTARDVMDAGLPLLTLSGQTFISRMAGSLLHHAGLNELICDSLPSYEERLRQLMADPAKVKSLKKRLKLKARHWKKSPQQLASSLERQLKVMYSERQADIQAKLASVTSR